MAWIVAIGVGFVIPLSLALLTRLASSVIGSLGLLYGAGWFIYGWAATRDDPASEWYWLAGVSIAVATLLPWLVGTIVGAWLRNGDRPRTGLSS